MMGKPLALVTGGATGIGAACCRALAAEGFRVGIHYRSSAQKAQKLLEEIQEGFLLQADLSQIEQVDAMIEKIKGAAGRVDVLVNNAGFSINADIISMKAEQFDA
ncbi:MAG TPA: SDR family NAD(P)-dependent oxidoreductase, partial [Smithella sp.]|nr:SDR family NAD(P)-dependent oxidoreductase [Smithella sp.]